jgi:hypothetical protein
LLLLPGHGLRVAVQAAVVAAAGGPHQVGVHVGATSDLLREKANRFKAMCRKIST